MTKQSVERRVRSLKRERQRLWGIFFNAGGTPIITVRCHGNMMRLREDVVPMSKLVETYLFGIATEIEQLTELLNDISSGEQVAL